MKEEQAPFMNGNDDLQPVLDRDNQYAHLHWLLERAVEQLWECADYCDATL